MLWFDCFERDLQFCREDVMFMATHTETSLGYHLNTYSGGLPGINFEEESLRRSGSWNSST